MPQERDCTLKKSNHSRQSSRPQQQPGVIDLWHPIRVALPVKSSWLCVSLATLTQQISGLTPRHRKLERYLPTSSNEVTAYTNKFIGQLYNGQGETSPSSKTLDYSICCWHRAD
jgi:hypothetical protein